MSFFVKQIINREVEELCKKNSNILAILYLFGNRVRMKDCEITGLKKGQCFMGRGDFSFTEQKYRTAKACLEKYHILTFKGTSKGCIVTLLDARFYDLNKKEGNEQNNEQTTSKQRLTENVESKSDLLKENPKEKRAEKNKQVLKELKTHNFFKNDDFVSTWENLKDYRGAKFTVIAKIQTLRKLFKHDLTISIDAMQNTMSNGWSGIFPERKSGVKNNGFLTAAEKQQNAINQVREELGAK